MSDETHEQNRDTPGSKRETTLIKSAPSPVIGDPMESEVEEQIDEITRPTDTFTKEFVIRIDDFRARQMSANAYLKLQSSLNLAAAAILSSVPWLIDRHMYAAYASLAFAAVAAYFLYVLRED